MSPSTWNLRLNWLPSEKHRLQPISAYNVWTVRASENVQLSRIGSRPRTFQRAIDEVRTLLLTPPKGVSKSEFFVFVNKIQVLFKHFVAYGTWEHTHKAQYEKYTTGD